MKTHLKFSLITAMAIAGVVPNLALADNTELLGGEFTSSGSTYQGNNGDDRTSNQTIGITIGSNDYSTKDIRAGFSANGPLNKEKDPINNEVIMNGGEVNNIYGAVARMVSGNRFTAKNNTVTIGGGKVKGKIYGGYGQSGGNAISNEVSITNGDVSEVYGGSGDTANKNKVTISGGTTNQIFGGNGISEASENEVLITGGIIKSTVNGGYINGTGTVSNNKVTISDGTVNANVFGGYSYNGLAIGNTVTISGGTVSGSVYGGRSVASDAATNNIVIISGGSIEGDVIGGYANSTPYSNFEATGNTVTYTGGTINGKIRVGYSGYTGADMLTGNTLNIGIADKKISNTLSAENIYNFENLNFYLANGIANNFTALNLTGTGNTDLSKSTVTAYLSNASNLTKDSVVHLIKTAGTLTAPLNNDSEQTNVNIASLVNVKGYMGLSSDSKSLDLTFKDTSVTPTWVPVDQTYNIVASDKFTRLMQEEGNPSNQETQEFTISGDFDKEELTEQSNNTVNINLGSNSFNEGIFGGGDYSTDTKVSGNTVTLNSGEVGFIDGGAAYKGEVSANKVIINGGTINSSVLGGFSNSGAVSGNSVTISSGTIGDVYGGNSQSGAVSGNSVTISSGTIGSVYGGQSTSGAVSGNSVTISGGTINGNVYGGFSNKNTATDNTVNFTGGTIKGTIYGGLSDDASKDMLTGNTLNIGTSGNPVIGLSARDIVNFETINFYLPSTVSNGDTALSLTTTEDTGLYGTNVNAYLSNASGLTKDSVIHLISTQGTLVDFDEANGNANLTNVNIAGLINVTGKIALDSTQKNLDLTFNGDEDTGGGSGSGGSGSGGSGSGGSGSGGSGSGGSGSGGGNSGGGSTGGGSTGGGSGSGGSGTGGGNSGGGNSGGGSTITADENAKLLLEGKLSQSIAVNESTNLFLSNLSDIANSSNNANLNSISNNANTGEANVFALVGGSDKRYKTGSHVDVKGFNAIAGIAGNDYYNSGTLTTGLFIEYAKGKFESVLDNGSQGEGKTELMGGGAFIKFMTTNNFYTEASAKVGKVKAEYDKGIHDEFDISSTYYGAHLGFGKIFNLTNSNELDIYARGIWSKTAGNDLVLNGVNTHFDSVTSLRAQIGFKDNIKLSDTSKLYAGLAYQYEFDGESKGNLTLPSFGTANIAAPKLKGSTAIAELGYTYETNSIKFDIGAKGYTGKEKGYSGNLGVTFKF